MSKNLWKDLESWYPTRNSKNMVWKPLVGQLSFIWTVLSLLVLLFWAYWYKAARLFLFGLCIYTLVCFSILFLILTHASVYLVGTLFSSMMFPDRAPDDQYLYTTFVGGSHNRDLAGAPTYKSYFDCLCSFSILARFSWSYTCTGLFWNNLWLLTLKSSWVSRGNQLLWSKYSNMLL